MTVPVTALYVCLASCWILFLAGRVVFSRRANRVDIGDGGHHDLQRAIRAHANAVEYLPTTLILMLVLELNGGLAWFLHVCGGLLIFARMYHSWGFIRVRGTSLGRFLGTSLNWLLIIALVVANLVFML